VGFGVKALSIGVGGLPGILSIMFEYWLLFALCMLLAIVVPFALTFVVGSRRLSSEDRYGRAIAIAAASSESAAASASAAAAVAPTAAAASFELLAPLSGTVCPISEVPDDMFANKVLGDGIAIKPAAGADTVVAPADATVSATMPGSNHAIGLTLDSGLEVLIHVGIDTVDMGGDGFVCNVKQGQHVKAGERLLTFSTDKIAAAGHSTITAVVLTETGDATDIEFLTGMEATTGTTTVVTYRA
jgi:PTS system trehalose-specific IIC component